MLRINSNSKKDKGFTIVELLVVIVVIGILAAITIVSYTGITNKAKTAKAQQNASSVQSLVEIFYTDSTTGAYPADKAAIDGYSGTTKLPAGISIVASGAGALSGATNDESKIVYQIKTGGGGACIGYWDFTGTPGIKYVFAGSASTAALNQVSPTCS